MIFHRDSPEIEPEEPDAPRLNPSRRFARLVESTGSRRLSRSRLALAAAFLSGLVAVVFFGARLTIDWVGSHSDQQLAFSRIELVPEPDRWIKGGRAQILEEVRIAARYPETISLLGLDLKSFKKDFALCPWVKAVHRVERSYGRLVVHLAYRKPAAVVVLRRDGRLIAYPVDEEGVAVSDQDIDWTSKEPPFQVRWISTPLIQIRGVESAAVPRFGIPWKRAGADGTLEDDPLVLGAARIADFLQRHPRASSSPRSVPEFVEIWLPDKPVNSFALIDSEKNWVEWGKPPGDEKPGEPSSDDRWKMLLDWVELKGPLNAKAPNFLRFTRSGAEFVDRTSRRPR